MAEEDGGRRFNSLAREKGQNENLFSYVFSVKSCRINYCYHEILTNSMAFLLLLFSSQHSNSKN